MSDPRRILVTGGSGFIGSAVCRRLVGQGHHVVNLDKMTYSATRGSTAMLEGLANYRFAQLDICDGAGVARVMAQEAVDAVMHLAAESHVDRSIDRPGDFITTNIVGTYTILEAALHHWRGLDADAAARFRFHHISTDEVFGDLPFDSGLFTEETKYAPSSPYSASKASSDHLVAAWHRTFGLPTVLSNCSNNYGPYQFPEKLIPLTILNAFEERPLPVYGQGLNVRDWLHVDDHAAALEAVLLRGQVGTSYVVGGHAERRNIDVVHAICAALDERCPRAAGKHADLITYVTDRPGHDARYAIDSAKIERELGWRAQHSFASGLGQTVDWYLANRGWWEPLRGASQTRVGMSAPAASAPAA